MEMQMRKTKISETADTILEENVEAFRDLAKTSRPAVSSQADNTIEIQLDRDLEETVEKAIAPMGWTVEEYIQAIVEGFTEYCADPANKEIVAALVEQWQSEGLLSSSEE